MRKGKNKVKGRRSPTKQELAEPIRIPDTPENIMRALVRTPPKKRVDWKYLKEDDTRAQ